MFPEWWREKEEEVPWQDWVWSHRRFWRERPMPYVSWHHTQPILMAHCSVVTLVNNGDQSRTRVLGPGAVLSYPPEQKGIGILVHVLRVWGEPEAAEEPRIWHPVHQPFRGQEPGLLLSAREDRALRAGFQLCHSLFTLAHRGQVVLTWLIFSFAEVWREAGKDTATVKCTASFLLVTNTQNFLSDLDNTDNFQQENKQIPWKCSLIGIYILLDDSFEKWKLLLL